MMIIIIIVDFVIDYAYDINPKCSLKIFVFVIFVRLSNFTLF